MRTYMLQWFQPTLEEDAFLRLSQALTHSAASLTSEGTPIRHLASALSRPDEMAFCLVEGPSSEAATEVGTRAGLLIERLTEAVFISGQLEEAVGKRPVADAAALKQLGKRGRGPVEHARRGCGPRHPLHATSPEGGKR